MGILALALDHLTGTWSGAYNASGACQSIEHSHANPAGNWGRQARSTYREANAKANGISGGENTMRLPMIPLRKQELAERPILAVGQEFPVGGFFWIDTCLGFAENARHGHGIDQGRRPGSADTDCRVRILRIDGNAATVVLLRREMPYGALAPHGTIFLLPVEQILRWPEMAAERERQERARAEFRRQLGRVVI